MFLVYLLCLASAVCIVLADSTQDIKALLACLLDAFIDNSSSNSAIFVRWVSNKTQDNELSGLGLCTLTLVCDR
jgi:hypothetical protein